MKVTITPSKLKGKKYTAYFEDDKTHKTIHFGAAGMSDYTLNKDPARRQRYLDRHRANEDWNTPYTAGSLSRWILWETPSLTQNIALFKRRFNLT
jgi:hypothetical protein